MECEIAWKPAPYHITHTHTYIYTRGERQSLCARYAAVRANELTNCCHTYANNGVYKYHKSAENADMLSTFN